MSTITWAKSLGLTPSELFGHEPALKPAGEHFALLDGVAASFLMSEGMEQVLEPRTALTWAWSANVRAHVTLDPNYVTLHKVARGVGSGERFRRQDVEGRLDAFLESLIADRRSPNQDVIDTLIQALHKVRVRLRGRHANLPDVNALQAFLLLAAGRIEGERLRDATHAEWVHLARSYAVPPETVDLLEQPGQELRDFEAELDLSALSLGFLELGVAVRHAGGALFQQANAEISNWTQGNVFTGYYEGGVARPDLTAGAFFTPPGLARSLVEICLRDVSHRAELVVADYACGSGVFLTETIRALRRQGFAGQLTLVGRDTSEVAVATARFSIACARMDWPEGRLITDVRVGDSLSDEPLPAADIVLMNPPFRSWESLDSGQRDRLKNILGDQYKGRPDLCMAFISKAFAAMREDGRFGCLAPVGILASTSAEKWRDHLGSHSRLTHLASLGDHALFRYATVNIGMIVLERGPHQVDTAMPRLTQMVWADETADAASTALRELRRGGSVTPQTAKRQRAWSIYALDGRELSRRSTWLPRPNAFSHLIGEIREANPTTLLDLFEIKQGARAGLRDAFILSTEQLEALPEQERTAFRPVAENDTLRKGQIIPGTFAFYPAVSVESEEDLVARFPVYFATYLAPRREALSKRKKIKHWWEMTWPRTWLRDARPKIVSPMFADAGNFALDESGHHVVCQGYGWLPKRASQARSSREGLRSLKVYCALFNSKFFFDLVREFSTNVAGGQMDLAPKYVQSIPCPDWENISRRVLTLKVEPLVEERRSPNLPNVTTGYVMRNEVAIRLYGLSPELVLDSA